ncbi:AMP-binding protein [Salmonella enterica subsp. enterica]|nr:AMP-binding protein [Salmonella enterica subsp. enterica]
MHDEVNAVAAMLLSLDVQRGDRVLVYMPMIAEAQITLLAARALARSIRWSLAVSHSVAARIDDARPALIVSADAGARAVKSLPYKSCLMTLLRRRQHQPKHVLLVDRGLGENGVGGWARSDFATLRQQHLRRVPVAWLNQ